MTRFDAIKARIEAATEPPRVVCLCGSTRFWQAFRDEGLRETLAGRIVLSIGIAAPDSETFAHATDDAGREIKARLDILHKQKIDMADEVLTLNVGGYIGDSTRSEIAYAIRRGKKLRWLEPDSAPAWVPMEPVGGPLIARTDLPWAIARIETLVAALGVLKRELCCCKMIDDLAREGTIGGPPERICRVCEVADPALARAREEA